MRLLGKSVHDLCHAFKEKSLCFFLAAMHMATGNKLIGLRGNKSGKEIGIDQPYRAA